MKKDLKLEFFHTSHDKKVKYTNEKHTFLINIEALSFFSPGRIFIFFFFYILKINLFVLIGG